MEEIVEDLVKNPWKMRRNEYSTEIHLAVMRRNGYELGNIVNQTEEICIEAMRQNGWALQYVKNQTEEICLEAVKQLGVSLYFVENQTEEICLEAVRQNGNALKEVKEQTIEICLEAMMNPVYSHRVNDVINLELGDERRLLHIKDLEMKEICRKYLKYGTRFMRTKSAKR